MMRTLFFIDDLQRDEKKREQFLNAFDLADDSQMDIRGWHLHFRASERLVTITSNGTDDYLESKFLPAEIGYDLLKHLLVPGDPEPEIVFRFLYEEDD